MKHQTSNQSSNSNKPYAHATPHSSTLPTIDPSTFNQTIIINNPNFNINYIESISTIGQNQNQSHHHPHNYPQYDPSRKVDDPRKTQNDSWNLNSNLKQFSQTRQLHFFNSKTKKTDRNDKSPYILPKTRTQDIKATHKIRTPQTVAYLNNQTHYNHHQHPYNPAYKNGNKSIPVITRQQSHNTLEPRSNINTNAYGNISNNSNKQIFNNAHVINGTTSSFRTKKYTHTQRTPRQLSSDKSQIEGSIQYLAKLEDERITNGKEVKQALTQKLRHGFTATQKPNILKINNIRRNRFSSLQQQDHPSARNTQLVSQPLEKQHLQIGQSSDSNNCQQVTQLCTLGHKSKLHSQNLGKYPLGKHREQQSQNQNYNYFSKSIQLIQNSLLGNLNSYLDGQKLTEDMPGSKLQLYVTTMRQPEYAKGRNPEYRSTPIVVQNLYQFGFEDEPKNKLAKRPKTPKKNKLHD